MKRMSNDFFIAGAPATFATKGEIPWRSALTRSIEDPGDQDFLGVRLSFTLPTLEPKGHPLDVDNLCEPVFSILINDRGFFKGRRPNLRWWQATKVRGEKCGVRVILEESRPPDLAYELGEPSFNQLYSGTLPSSATDPDIPNWLSSLEVCRAVNGSGRFALQLDFLNPRVNVGNIASGTVKSTIDCLYPLLGGNEGKPEDWRIDRLLVTKGFSGDASGAVRIALWDIFISSTREKP
jgi:hypothetical protein